MKKDGKFFSGHRKWLSVLLVVSVIMSLMPTVAFADDGQVESSAEPAAPASAVQIVERGGTRYYDENGTDVTGNGTSVGNGAVVGLSKTIEGTEAENVFDITLQVETTLEMEENITITETPDAAVVLTFDLSGTMARYEMDGETYIEVAKEKALEFIVNYAQSAGTSSAKRMLAIAGFDTDAKLIMNWIDVNPNNNPNWYGTSTTVVGAVDNIMEAYTKLIVKECNCGGYDTYYCNHSCTNFDGGVILTKNLFKQEAVASISAEKSWGIILSDGAPTVTVSGDTSTVDEIKSTFWNGQGYANAKSGGGWTHAQEVVNAKTYLTALAGEANVNMIGVGGDMDFPLFFDAVYKYKSNNGSSRPDVAESLAAFGAVTPAIRVVEVDKCSSACSKEANTTNWCLNHVLTAGNMTTGDWLSALATSVGGNYASAADSVGLANAFNSIFNTIKTKTETQAIYSSAWNAVDPVGAGAPNYVEFVNFYDKDGNTAENLTGSCIYDGEDTASLENNTIDWDLKSSGYVTREEDGQTIYTYAIKYRVRLANEKDKFVEVDDANAYDTNGTTTFSYQTVENNQFGAIKNVNFPIPSVKGYLGELTFTKTAYNQPLNGAKFELAHDTDCSLCSGVDVETKKVVPSGTVLEEIPGEKGETPHIVEKPTGQVSFLNIPSGHVYILRESEAPSGFAISGDEYRVTVAYDVLTVDKIGIDAKTHTKTYTPVDISDMEISNTLKLDLGAHKTLNGAELEAGQFAFNLLAADKTTVLQTGTNDENGNVKFSVYLTDFASNYIFYIQEVAADAFGVVYDKTVYQVVATPVAAADGGYTFEVKYSKVGEDADAITAEGNASSETPGETAPVTAEFVNEYLQPVDLTVTKAWAGEGDHPESVYVRLMKNGQPYTGTDYPSIVELRLEERVVEEDTTTETPEVPAEDKIAQNEESKEETTEETEYPVGLNWTFVWEDLDATETWSVEEIPVPGYETGYVTNMETNTITITNTKAKAKVPDDVPTVSFISCNAIKEWADNDNEKGIRPDSVTVQLMQDGKAYGEGVVLNEGNNWSCTWKMLPSTSRYEVVEIYIPEGYTSKVTKSGYNFTVTNTYAPVIVDNPDVPTGDKEIKDPEDPTLELEDSDVPADYMEIEDCDVPKTSDDLNLNMWMVIAILSALALGASFVVELKQNR